MKGLSEFLIERISETVQHNKDNCTFSLNGIGSLTYNDFVVTYPVETPNAYEIDTIVVNPEKMHKGNGTKLLKAFLEYTDKKKVDVVVYASPLSPRIEEDQLIEMYTKCGFEQDTRSKDKHCLIRKHK